LGPEVPGASGLTYDSDESDGEDDVLSGSSSSKCRNTNVWQRAHHQFTHSSTNLDDDPHSDDVLSQEFLRKYLHFAKTRIQPVLTEGAREAIASRYAEMRSRQDERTLPITARSLETIIRLASAHAKARLSHSLEADPDVAAAMDILGFALYHEQTGISAVKREREEIPQGNDEILSPSRRARVSVVEGEDENVVSEELTTSASATSNNPIEEFKRKIWEALNKNDGQVEVSEVPSDAPDSIKEKALKEMENEQRIYRSGGTLFQI